MLLYITLLPVIGSTQTLPSDYRVLNETDTVWHFGYNGFNLFERSMHRIDIGYPSKAVNGNDVELSGFVCIPAEVYSGEQPCDGVLLYNHYSALSKAEAPTRGYCTGIDFVMANPLKPNYIVVTSDFLGFGLTEDSLQAYCFNDVNGQASIDCLLAARRLLDDRGISQGRYLFNAGYSSGGFDAVATQRVRDMKYSDQVVFDKTFIGGEPFDMIKAYDTFLSWKDDTTAVPTFVPLILGMVNHHAHLGFTNEQMFKEPLASCFDDLYLSGTHNNEEGHAFVKGMTLSELVQDAFLDASSEEYKTFRQALRDHSLANGWTPDSTQRYYVSHLLRDNYVPIAAGRAFIDFLTDFSYGGKRAEGFKRSIVPERTGLQTNFFIPSEQHTLVGGISFYLTLAAELTAHPVLYYDGELNTHYADLVESATLMGIIRTLEEKGIDVRTIVKSLSAGDGESGGTDFFSFLAQLDETLSQYGTSTSEVLQIALDSGLEFTDIMELYQYFNQEPTGARKFQVRSARALNETCLMGYYERYLYQWLKENNVNIYDETK